MTGRFCLWWLGGVVAIVAAIGIFDTLVDPYLVIGTPRIAGFNAIKPETETHSRLAKGYLLRRAHPAGVLIGDSKVDIGLDPKSPSWPSDARPAFDLGLPGSTIAEDLSSLRRAVADGPVRRALVMIEIKNVMAADDPASDADAPKLSGADGFTGGLTDTLLATLSTDALRASVLTVAAQHRADVPDITALGSTGEGGFRAIVRTDGYDTLFVQKDAVNVASAIRLAAALAARPGASLHDLGAVQAIIAFCRERGIALDLAIAPTHADALDALDRAGLWPRYEAAKRALVLITAATGTTLWDFSGYDAFSTEKIPTRSDRNGVTKWFWEPNHFKKTLGEVIFETLYGEGREYGIRLTPVTVEARLEQQRSAKFAYRAVDSGGRDRLARASGGGVLNTYGQAFAD